jgi:hypothetical protein
MTGDGRLFPVVGLPSSVARHISGWTQLKCVGIIARAESLKEQRSAPRRPCDPPFDFGNAPAPSGPLYYDSS